MTARFADVNVFAYYVWCFKRNKVFRRIQRSPDSIIHPSLFDLLVNVIVTKNWAIPPFFFLTFNFILEHSQLTMVWQQPRDSAIYIPGSTLPQTPLPSRLPHNIEQSSQCAVLRSLLVIHFKCSSVYMSIFMFFFFLILIAHIPSV